MTNVKGCTITEETYGMIKKVSFAWTSSANGTEVSTGVTTSNSYNGEVIRLVTVPGSGHSAPSAGYDIAITDGDSVDILNYQGYNRSSSDTEYVNGSLLGCVVNDTLTLDPQNAGATNTGTAIVYIR